MKIKGLDKMRKQFKQLEKGLKELSATKSIPFDELFTENFMQKYTDYRSFDEFLKAGGYEVNSQEDFEKIDDAEFDSHVAKNSKFDTWEQMLGKATDQYVANKLKL